MAFDIGTAVGYLDLDTSGLQRGFKTALSDIEAFGDRTNSASQRTYALGSAMTSVGSTLTTNVTLPLVGIGTAAMAVGNKFESAMSRVKGVSGATGKEFEALKDQALDLGASTAFSASEAAAGMENLASAGFTANEIIAAMPGLLDLAASSGADLATASEIAASAIRGFGLGADKAGHVADVFAEAAARTNAQTEDMGEAMKYVAPVASAMSQSLEETAAAIGIMSDAGIKGSQAGTSLRGALSRLAKPTKDMNEIMDRFSLSFFDAQGKMLPLNGIVKQLETSLGGLTEEQRNNALVTLFGQESLSGMLALMSRGSDELIDLTKSFENADGAAANMAEVMMDNTSGSIEEMMGSLETLAIKVQQVLAPVVVKVANWLTELINKLSSMDEEILTSIVAIGGAAAAAGPILTVLGKLLQTIGSMPTAFKSAGGAVKSIGAALVALPPIVYIIIAIIAVLTGAFVTLWKTNEEFRNKVVAIWEGVKETFTSFFEQLTEKINSLGFNFNNFGEVLKALWMGLCEFLGPLILGAFNDIWTGIKATLDVILGVVDFFIALFRGDWEGVWNAVKSIFVAVWDSIVALLKNNFGVIMEQLNIVCGWFGTTWEAVWGSIKTFFVSTWTSIADFFVGIWTSIKDFFVGLWSSITGAIQAAWDWVVGLFSTVASWVYSNVIAPVAQFFTDLWNSIVSAYHTVIDPWIEIFRRLSVIVYNEIIQPIVQFFTNLWNTIVTGLGSTWAWITKLLSTMAGWVDEKVIQPVSSFFTELWNSVSDLAAQCWETIKGVWQVVSGWFNTNLVQPIKSFFAGMWSSLIGGASNAWNGIKSVFSSVATFFGSIFKTAWDKVKAVFSTGGKIFDGIKDGIVKAFKTVVNAIIKGLNKVVKLPFQGLNNVLDKIQNVSIVGVKPFDWITWRAPIPNIPLLAEGAVLPANNPFLAIVGDQKQGTNVEAPLSTIQEAVALVFESFATPMVKLQEMTVVILGDILQAVIGVNQLQNKLQNLHEATRQFAFSNFDFPTTSSQGIDYGKLAAYLAAALQSAPIQPKISVEMQDGDVYLDKERVGRSLAPTVSRIVTQKN